jgi:hypothetical protein
VANNDGTPQVLKVKKVKDVPVNAFWSVIAYNGEALSLKTPGAYTVWITLGNGEERVLAADEGVSGALATRPGLTRGVQRRRRFLFSSSVRWPTLSGVPRISIPWAPLVTLCPAFSTTMS